ncbi:hypothetical protein, partial [Roseibacillus persicicus]|uniref:hypothetical protein n=1 Tax=Roseibacillus persicicus TaxID=454148 RepID=UPI001E6351E2
SDWVCLNVRSKMLGNYIRLAAAGLVLASCDSREPEQTAGKSVGLESFPNKKLIFQTGGRRHYEIHQYGDISYIRNADADGSNRIMVGLRTQSLMRCGLVLNRFHSSESIRIRKPILRKTARSFTMYF